MALFFLGRIQISVSFHLIQIQIHPLISTILLLFIPFLLVGNTLSRHFNKIIIFINQLKKSYLSTVVMTVEHRFYLEEYSKMVTCYSWQRGAVFSVVFDFALLVFLFVDRIFCFHSNHTVPLNDTKRF